MPSSSVDYKKQFFAGVAVDIKRQLLSMEQDEAYVTSTSYSPSNPSEGDMSFTQKHLTYLSMHPKVNPASYMSNLRLKTKINSHRR